MAERFALPKTTDGTLPENMAERFHNDKARARARNTGVRQRKKTAKRDIRM